MKSRLSSIKIKKTDVEIIDGDRGINYPKKNDFSSCGYCLFLDASNVTKNGFVFDNPQFITQAKDDQLGNGKLKRHDIVLTTRGTIGNFAYYDVDIPYDNVRINSGMLILRNGSDFDTKYLYQLLKSPYVKQQIINMTTGSSQPQITRTIIKELILLKPELPTQIQISNILYTLDKKIELNNRINTQLEKLAKLIYDYWFVQFDFPDEKGNPYKSSGGKMVWSDELKREIPKKWEVKPLHKEVDIQYGYPFKTTLFTDLITEKPIARIRDIQDNTISTYTTEAVENKYMLQKGDVVIGMDGNFHINFWFNDGIYLNQRCVRVRTRNISLLSNYQVYFEIAPHIKLKERNVSRTTVGHLSDKDIKDLNILIPDDSLNFKPKVIFDKLLEELVFNRKEKQNLVELRDWLLPMLMNGQVKVIQ